MLRNINTTTNYEEKSFLFPHQPLNKSMEDKQVLLNNTSKEEAVLPEILILSTYTPVECGIATYSTDLFQSLKNKFSSSFDIQVCALEPGVTDNHYPSEVKYVLDTTSSTEYHLLADIINKNHRLKIILVQHEFGFFKGPAEQDLILFLNLVRKPIVIVFHTVLPRPDPLLKARVEKIAALCDSIIVMTNISAGILVTDYQIPEKKIAVIPHGTHLVLHVDKLILKRKYLLEGRKVLSTFGLLSSGKSIETTLEALPAIIEINKEVIFLIIGKTHPGILKSEGEKYRNFLKEKVVELKLEDHVRFINSYLPLSELLEYLQLTDIYLFTSKDPNQAVSGTFAYAMSCACPIISTPIPHARELLIEDAGIIVDFQNVEQLTSAIIRLLSDEKLLAKFTANTLQQIAPTAWENSAIAHAILLEQVSGGQILLDYTLPEINLSHLKKMTTDIGIVQFSKFNQPDPSSGFTLDDNARALIALCMHFEITGTTEDINYLYIYLSFIKHCQKEDGSFLNYVNDANQFTDQNKLSNLEDANGRAIWALGYMISLNGMLPEKMILIAEQVIRRILLPSQMMRSPRAMAFSIKGLYYYNLKVKSSVIGLLIKTLADRLVQLYKHEKEEDWQWFESYITYANSILPEAMLCAWQATGEKIYKDIAKESFDFLLAQTFTPKSIKIISNKSWLQKGKLPASYGEQPIDVAYTILSLKRFYTVFNHKEYQSKIKLAFTWFLGNNHLHQVIYNPCTGGCYDGLEENHVNLNQGAESTISYLMARLTVESQLNLK